MLPWKVTVSWLLNVLAWHAFRTVVVHAQGRQAHLQRALAAYPGLRCRASPLSPLTP